MWFKDEIGYNEKEIQHFTSPFFPQGIKAGQSS
jgi:hypothetical protein